MFTEILSEKETHFKGIRKRFMFSQEFFRFAFGQRFRRAFVVQNIAYAELILDEDCGVEGNLVPIGEGVTAFNTEGSLLSVPTEGFDRVFDRYAEAVRQTDFNFLSELMVGPIEAKRIALINQSGKDAARR